MAPLSSVATTHHHPPVCGRCVCVCVCALHIPAIAVVVWYMPHGPPLLRPNPN